MSRLVEGPMESWSSVILNPLLPKQPRPHYAELSNQIAGYLGSVVNLFRPLRPLLPLRDTGLRIKDWLHLHHCL